MGSFQACEREKDNLGIERWYLLGRTGLLVCKRKEKPKKENEIERELLEIKVW